MDFEKCCDETIALVRETGAFIRNEGKHFNPSAVEEKSFNQLVSYVDRTAEEKLVEGLKRILPGCGFITEENTVTSEEKEFMWIIDPLDGTTNFVHHIPVYSISVGLLQHVPAGKKLVLGIVYEINLDEMFYAWEGSKAFLNGKEITVSRNAELSKSLLATGFPYYDFHIMEKYLETLHVLMRGSQGMRRLGSAAVDLVYVACGRFDGFFEFGLNAWDVAGGAFIVQQAGGKLSDFSGNADYLFGKEIVASSSALYEPFFKVVNEKFKG